jgi:hypothetical protein
MSLCGSGAGLYFMEKPSLLRAGMSPSKEPLITLRLMLELLLYQVGIPQTYIEPSESMAWKDLYQLEDRSEAGRTDSWLTCPPRPGSQSEIRGSLLRSGTERLV